MTPAMLGRMGRTHAGGVGRVEIMGVQPLLNHLLALLDSWLFQDACPTICQVKMTSSNSGAKTSAVPQSSIKTYSLCEAALVPQTQIKATSNFLAAVSTALCPQSLRRVALLAPH